MSANLICEPSGELFPGTLLQTGLQLLKCCMIHQTVSIPTAPDSTLCFPVSPLTSHLGTKMRSDSLNRVISPTIIIPTPKCYLEAKSIPVVQISLVPGAGSRHSFPFVSIPPRRAAMVSPRRPRRRSPSGSHAAEQFQVSGTPAIKLLYMDVKAATTAPRF
jgi:hypothetical protein